MKSPAAHIRFMPTSHGGEDLDYDALAEVVLRVAEEVEEAEVRIKDAILAAAERGDTEQVARIVRRWKIEPPAAVAADLEED